jgi:hypothetical protein
MKTKSLFLAMLIGLSSTALAFENDEPQMTVVSVKGSEVFKVIYKGRGVGRIKLNIFDAQGKMIHAEAISGLNGFIIPVNFKGLPSGAYTIEVVDETGSYRQKISYLPFYELKSIHISRMANGESKYLLAISNAQNEAIRIRIYDATERVVFDESKVINGDFAQVFKITQAHGRYTFEVSDARGIVKHFAP